MGDYTVHGDPVVKGKSGKCVICQTYTTVMPVCYDLRCEIALSAQLESAH